MSLTSNTVSFHLTISESMQMCIPLLKEVFEAFLRLPLTSTSKSTIVCWLRRPQNWWSSLRESTSLRGNASSAIVEKCYKEWSSLAFSSLASCPLCPFENSFLKFQCLLSSWSKSLCILPVPHYWVLTEGFWSSPSLWLDSRCWVWVDSPSSNLDLHSNSHGA